MQGESIQERGRMSGALPERKHILSRRWRRRIGKAVLSLMGCLVMAGTARAMILPASAEEGTSYCGYEAHEHGEACYEKTPVCELAKKESGHTHGPECYTEQKTLKCGEEEREAGIHTHSEGCRTQQKELTCTLEEREAGTHAHGAQCYTEQRKLICTQEENTAVHTHTEGCIAREQRLICADTNEGHAHAEACYETTESVVCGLTEGAPLGHVHTDGCYSTEKVLSCTLREGETIPGHTHTDACYSIKEILSCGFEDGEAIPAHKHTEACYGTEKVLSCEIPESAPSADTGAEDSAHTHTDKCYKKMLICKKTVHRHKLSCFSNPAADRESEGVWERSLAGVELSGEWGSDLVAIAKTQLGYTESARNYLVAKNGAKMGYTRYGAWYGIEYGDWCAMFVSFCLHYAQIPEESFPPESACENWINTLKSEKYALYREKEEYTPSVGDVIFFDWGTDGKADHVGIVAELRCDGKGALTGLQTIEGNTGNRVGCVEYTIEDKRILGYGELPENPIVTYRWRGDGVEVTVSLERSEELPEDAKLVVQRLSPQGGRKGYAAGFAAAQKTLAAEGTAEIAQFELFRMYLEADGKEILTDVEATVEVRLLDKETATETKNEAEEMETKLFSYSAGGAKLRTPEQSSKGDGLSVRFKTKLSGEYAIAGARGTDAQSPKAPDTAE